MVAAEKIAKNCLIIFKNLWIFMREFVILMNLYRPNK